LRVLLINPKEEGQVASLRNGKIRFAPLSLQILAALTPDNAEVDIVDENFKAINFDEDYHLVAMTSCHASPNESIKRICTEFKTRGVPVVLGGVYPSLRMRNALKDADSIAVGEAEATWLSILADAKKDCLKKIYKHGLIDLNSNWPIPRRDLTYNKKYYAQIVEVSRGCPYNCSFCVTSYLNKGKYRFFPIERVLKDVENAKDNSTLIKNHIFLSDDNLAIEPQYKIELLKKMVPHEIIWTSQSDISIAQNEALLSAAAKSGCYQLFIGFESLNQRSLKSVRKNHNVVKEYKKAVKAIHNQGIHILGSFIFGMDHDTPGVGKKTLEFINEVGIDRVVINQLRPFEGTNLFEQLKREGRIIRSPPEAGTEFSFRMKHLSEEEIEIERGYAERKKLLKLPVFNRNISWANAMRLLLYKIYGMGTE
jgi:radical SAM superfamily enzyme YgiQ (UPF0313 family)